ncbi:MAG: GDSL-type esterase/lipase family protein [Burkholderiales bacterium]
MKYAARLSIYTLALFLVLVAVYEIGSRFWRTETYERDAVLGWRLKPGVKATFKMRDASGAAYVAEFATDARGMRSYGSVASGTTNVLVLGDSFTADQYAGNQDMWFSVMGSTLEGKLGKKFFVGASGGAGYGTYQELLLAQRLAKSFVPDLVILQFCANDFFNNHLEWESSGIVASQFYRRPYFTEHGPAYVQGPLAWLFRSPIGESRFIAKISGVVEGIGYKHYGDYVRKLDRELDDRYQKESILITQNVLAKLRMVFPSSRAFIFNCSESTEGTLAPNRAFKEVAKSAGFTVLERPPHALAEAQKQGLTIKHADGGHLNPLGNKVLGEAVAEQLLSVL